MILVFFFSINLQFSLILFNWVIFANKVQIFKDTMSRLDSSYEMVIFLFQVCVPTVSWATVVATHIGHHRKLFQHVVTPPHNIHTQYLTKNPIII